MPLLATCRPAMVTEAGAAKWLLLLPGLLLVDWLLPLVFID